MLKGAGYEYLENQEVKLVQVYPAFIQIVNKYFDKLDNLDVLEVGIGNSLNRIPKSKLFKSYTGIEQNEKLVELSKQNCEKFDCKMKIIYSSIEDYETDDKYAYGVMLSVVLLSCDLFKLIERKEKRRKKVNFEKALKKRI